MLMMEKARIQSLAKMVENELEDCSILAVDIGFALTLTKEQILEGVNELVGKLELCLRQAKQLQEMGEKL
jgi:hypothetical protein